MSQLDSLTPSHRRRLIAVYWKLVIAEEIPEYHFHWHGKGWIKAKTKRGLSRYLTVQDVEDHLRGRRRIAPRWSMAERTRFAVIDLDNPNKHVRRRDRKREALQTTDRFGDEFLLNSRIAHARLRFGDGSEVPIRFEADKRGLVNFDVGNKTTNEVTLLIDDVHAGTRWHDLAVSEIDVR